MNKKILVGAFAACLSSGVFAGDKPNLPCFNGMPIDQGKICHSTVGFDLGCQLEHLEVVKLRELVDKNFRKKSAVTLTYADESWIYIDVQWNGEITKIIIDRQLWTYTEEKTTEAPKKVISL